MSIEKLVRTMFKESLEDLLDVSLDEKKLDPVNKKSLKKDFDDRKDKDIDNDGDVDDSDEYLHKRRKTISKAIKKDKELDEAKLDKSSPIYKEYEALKKKSIADLRDIIGRNHRVVNLKGYDKAGALRQILDDRFGKKKVNAFFGITEEVELDEAKSSVSKEEVAKLLMRYGYKPQQVKKMIDREFDSAVKKHPEPTASKIAVEIIDVVSKEVRNNKIAYSELQNIGQDLTKISSRLSKLYSTTKRGKLGKTIKSLEKKIDGIRNEIFAVKESELFESVELGEEASDAIRDFMGMGMSYAEAEARARQMYPDEFGYTPRRGGYQSYRRPKEKMAMYFFNVPKSQEDEARSAGLRQTKSGKWYKSVHPIPMNSKTYKLDDVLKNLEKKFGKGKYWDPNSSKRIKEEVELDELKVKNADEAFKLEKEITALERSILKLTPLSTKASPAGNDANMKLIKAKNRLKKKQERYNQLMNESVELDEARTPKIPKNYAAMMTKKRKKAGTSEFGSHPDEKEQKLFMFKTKAEAEKKAKEVNGKVVELTKQNFAVVTEEVELSESFKKGDSVTVKNAKKYDALSKPERSGTVIGMIGDKVMVKVGSGQMNVDTKDLVKESSYQESAELDESRNSRDDVLKKLEYMAKRDRQPRKARRR